MIRYIVPVLMSLVLIAVLVGVNRGFKSLSSYFSADFALGFIVGGVFCIVMYGLACGIDPASRPRGTGPAADQQRNRSPLD